MGYGKGVYRKKLLALFLLVCILLAAAIIMGIFLPKQREKQGGIPYFTKAAITTDAAECADIGKNVLLRNGTAVDSAIATLFCMGTVTPQSMGIGGGFLMIIYRREKNNVDVLDAREIAPGTSTPDMFEGNATAAAIGGRSIAIPGEVHGLYEAHRKYGRLPWASLVSYTINILKKGFRVSPHLANAIKITANKTNGAMRDLLTNKETNKLYQEGDLMRNDQLMKTFQTIAAEGAEGFYGGKVADALVQDIAAEGGIISKSDLQAYKSRWMTADQAKISNMTMYSCPLPGSGALLGFMLQILEGFRFSPQDSETLLFYHRAIETFKFAYAKRTEMEDSDSTEMRVLVKQLLSATLADEVRKKIVDNRTFDNPGYYGMKSQGNTDQYGTSHMAVIAPNGDAVSVTSTINSYFGSKVLSAKTGVIMNNCMDDFSIPGIVNKYGLKPSFTNQIAPYKRPLSSMAPAIFVDTNRDVQLAIGGNGGTQITSGIAMVVSRLLLLKEKVKRAVDLPRVHDQVVGNTLYEKELPKSIVEGLRKLGHNMVELKRIGSVILGIVRDQGVLYPYADPRKGGSVAGF